MISPLAFGCRLIDHIKVSSRALVCTVTDDAHSFCHVNDGIIPQTEHGQIVIALECFNFLSEADTAELEFAITEILGPYPLLEWDDKCDRIRELLAPHELRRRREVTTLLELGLWKSKLEESQGAGPGSREACRVHCGADGVIPHVLKFL